MPGDRFQFERTGYFIADSEDHREGKPVFNRIVPLRDSWKKIEAKGKQGDR
jgi:glutaminyl-tRNA synthetase